MAEKVQIQYLADVPHVVPTLAQWVMDSWSKYDPTLEIAQVTNSLKNKLNKDKIPLTFVALSDNIPVGMVSLKPVVKVKGYEDRNIWLGSFWVIDGYRKKGIGSQLLDTAFAKARELGYKKISLFASDPNAAEWYDDHGWEEFATDTYQGHPVVLMEYSLD